MEKPSPFEVLSTTVLCVLTLWICVPTDYQKRFGNSVREKPVTELTQSASASAPPKPTIN